MYMKLFDRVKTWRTTSPGLECSWESSRLFLYQFMRNCRSKVEWETSTKDCYHDAVSGIYFIQARKELAKSG